MRTYRKETRGGKETEEVVEVVVGGKQEGRLLGSR